MNCKYNEIDGRIFRLPSVTGKLKNAFVNLKNNNNWLKACFLFCDVTAEK